MKIKKIVIACLWASTLTLFCLSLTAQSVPCNIAGNFTATGDSIILDNTKLGCYQWRVAYTSTGFSGISISLQTATTFGGSFSDYTGATVVTDGTNPSTATTHAIIGIHSNGAFIKLHLATATGTGTVIYQVWGANSTTTSSALQFITGTSPIVVAGNNISCPTCGTASGNVTAGGTLANNAFVTGAGGTAIQTVTAATATSALNLFSSTLQGLVPLSGGGTTNFLRADGTFAAPPSSGGGGITTQSADLVGTRTLATNIQNTSATARFVLVTVSSAALANVIAITDASSTPTTVVGFSFVGATATVTIGFWVLAGNFYNVGTSVGTPTLNHWFEWN